MDLFYGVADVGTVVRAGYGWLDDQFAVTCRVQPRAIAPGGLAMEHALGPALLVVRRDGACRVTLTPIVAGKPRADLAVQYDLTDVPEQLQDDVLRRGLRESNGFSQQ